MAMSGTEAKASLISNRSMSATVSPALAQTFRSPPPALRESGRGARLSGGIGDDAGLGGQSPLLQPLRIRRGAAGPRRR